ncbi:MAG: hypothetical protein R3C14_17075 [Caldilineaceae bacterium]
MSANSPQVGGPGRPGWDALLLTGLIFALLMIMGFAEATLGNRVQDMARHPLLGQLIPAAGVAAMGEVNPRPGEPVGLVLYAVTLGLLGLYFVIDLGVRGRWQRRLKWVVLACMILTALYLPTIKLILLDAQGPRGSYSHDGGVLQTEATIQFLLQGKNPYVEDYTNTPMATWGHPAFRTALYHYPYLPWTFVFSAPFYLLGNALGFYDQRMVYLLLLAAALLVAPRLVGDPRGQLGLAALLAFNPIMALDVIFGQNDVFVLCWLIFSLVAWQHWRQGLVHGEQGAMMQKGRQWALFASACFFGLACASKPTVWFMAPFYGLLLVADHNQQLHSGMWRWLQLIPQILRRVAPGLVLFLLLVLPYIVWNPFAFYDDVWRWSNGQGETGYQIWGWGASNFVLALGLVADRFGQWPFGRLELLLALPLLVWFFLRQQRHNTLSHACWHYGVLLFVFFYGSRFLNENYLGYIFAVLALGLFAEAEPSAYSSSGSS